MSIRLENLNKLAAMQTKILRRFMSEEEVNELLTKYKKNSQGGTGMRRFDRMQQPLTIADKELLREYFYEEELSLTEMAKNRGSSLDANRINQLALFALAKLVFVNQDLLKLKELLGHTEPEKIKKDEGGEENG